MDDRLRESISALMDDEANELELQRILSKVDDEEVAATWHRYHQVRQVVRDCPPDVMSIDIRASLSERLHDEEFDSASKPSVEETYVKPVAGQAVVESRQSSRPRWIPALGVAASMVFALVFTLQNFEGAEQPGKTPLVADVQSQSVPVTQVRQPKVHVTFDERHARRFNEYLLRHAEHSAYGSGQGLMPLVRVASVNSVGI